MTDALFLAALFVANIIQAITGFAGTVLAMPISATLLGLDSAKVILNMLAIFSCLLITATGYRNTNWKEFGKIIAGMLVGMVIGAQLLTLSPSEDLLLRIYGVIIILVAIKGVLFKKEVTLSPVAGWIVLLLSGVIHGMFISGGALLVVYGVAKLKDKQQFRATIALCWVTLDSIIAITQLQQGLFTQSNINYILLSIIPLIIATYIGTKLAKRMKQQTFLNITYALLFISGISLLF